MCLKGAGMLYEMLVGLDVCNDKVYQDYRAAMTPILIAYQGSFGYDFRVSQVLKSQGDENINRVFTLRFPDEATKERFFNDCDYLAVKQQYFEKSVRQTTVIATYNK